MRVVIDTNVFISGIFFSGPPHQILRAWQKRKLEFILSPDILEEYRRVAEILRRKYPEVDIDSILEMLTIEAELTTVPSLDENICTDPEDDKFIACALASKTKIIISGDKHLLQVNGYRGLKIISPRQFLNHYLKR